VESGLSAVVFDLDGTLIDSAPDIAAAVNLVFQVEGAAPLPLNTVVSFIGNGLPKLAERAVTHAGLPMADLPRITRDIMAAYAADPISNTVLYPGVIAALDRLQATGATLGLCTNKPEAPARDLLDHFGLSGYFGSVIGGDTLATRKPDPEPLRACFAELGTDFGAYVGDSEVDAACAQNAAIPFFLFTEGYRKTPAPQIPHLKSFAHFDALPGLIAAAPA